MFLDSDCIFTSCWTAVIWLAGPGSHSGGFQAPTRVDLPLTRPTSHLYNHILVLQHKFTVWSIVNSVVFQRLPSFNRNITGGIYRQDVSCKMEWPSTPTFNFNSQPTFSVLFRNLDQSSELVPSDQYPIYHKSISTLLVLSTIYAMMIASIQILRLSFVLFLRPKA